MLTDLDSSLMPQIPEILEEVGGEDRIIEFVELLGWWATADKEGGLYAKVAMRIATSKLKQGLSLFIDSATVRMAAARAGIVHVLVPWRRASGLGRRLRLRGDDHPPLSI